MPMANSLKASAFTPADAVRERLVQHDFRALKTALPNWPAPELARFIAG